MSVEFLQSLAHTAGHIVEFIVAFMLLRGCYDIALWAVRARRRARYESGRIATKQCPSCAIRYHGNGAICPACEQDMEVGG